MKRLLEGWREKLSERSRRSSEIRGKNYKEFIEYLKGLGNSFVVFDTETTGLRAKDPGVQVTELAAVAYDMNPWYDNRGKPVPVQISNIPEEYRDFISPDGQFSVKINLTEPVEDLLKKQKALMAVTDKSDPLHIEYASQQKDIIAKKMAWAELDKQYANNPSLMQRKVSKKTGRPIKGMEPSQAGWRVWRAKRAELNKTLTPEDVPLYSETNTDFMSDAGYGPDDKTATLVALLRMGRYGSGDAPFKKISMVFDAFRVYLQLVEQSPQTDSVVVTAQNAQFDAGQMNQGYALLGQEPPDYEIFDTAHAFKEFITPLVNSAMEKIKSDGETSEREKKMLDNLRVIGKSGQEYTTVSLGPLTKAFDIPDLGWHAAIADVKMTMATFMAVLNYLDEVDRELEGGVQGGDMSDDEYMKNRYGVEVQDMPEANESIKKLQEEWDYALTRKQRELIEREILSLKKKL